MFNKSRKNTRMRRMLLFSITLMSYQFYLNVGINFHVGMFSRVTYGYDRLGLDYFRFRLEIVFFLVVLVFMTSLMNYFYAYVIKTIKKFKDNLREKNPQRNDTHIY
jgi:hypothetical protein